MGDLNARVIKDRARTGPENFAADHYCMDYAISSNQPVIRFYRWKNPTVSLGKSQSISDIDTAFCKKNRVDIARRPSGGNALMHYPDSLTYSVFLPYMMFFTGMPAFEQTMCAWVIDALSKMGIKFGDAGLNLRGNHHIFYGNKKLSGNAPWIILGTYGMMHGSVNTRIDSGLEIGVIKNINESNVNNIETLANIFPDAQTLSFDVLETMFINAFLQKNVGPIPFTKDEEGFIHELVKQYDEASLKENQETPGACMIDFEKKGVTYPGFTPSLMPWRMLP